VWNQIGIIRARQGSGGVAAAYRRGWDTRGGAPQYNGVVRNGSSSTLALFFFFPPRPPLALPPPPFFFPPFSFFFFFFFFFSVVFRSIRSWILRPDVFPGGTSLPPAAKGNTATMQFHNCERTIDTIQKARSPREALTHPSIAHERGTRATTTSTP